MKNFIYAFIAVLIGAISTFAQQGKVTFYPEVSWLPDGKHLSFTMVSGTNPKDFQADIYTVKADGTDVKKITDDDKNKFGASWSKDGKRVLFSAGVRGNVEESTLFITNRDGSNPTQLQPIAGRISGAAFSPDSKKIAFTVNQKGEKNQIYVMDANGKNVKRLTTNSTITYFSPQWSPDSKKIVYYSEKGDQKDQIWTMNADGTNQTLLTNNIAHNFYPAWASDGKKIIFTSNRDSENFAFYTVNLDGTNLTRVPNINGSMAKFSPDGKKIAFVSPKPRQPGKPPESSIYIANADGSEMTKVVGN